MISVFADRMAMGSFFISIFTLLIASAALAISMIKRFDP